MNPQQIAAVIDHTFLKTEHEGVTKAAQQQAVEKLLEEAHQYHAYSVCVRPEWVHFATQQLRRQRSTVKVVSVIGFPVGDDFPTVTVISQAQQAIADGATECDMVIKLQLFKTGRINVFQNDIIAISQALAHHPLKVIVENALIPSAQKMVVYRLVRDAIEQSWQRLGHKPLRFLKTSTGFARPHIATIPTGATLADIQLMKKVTGSDIGLKAAGGVDSFKDAVAYWQASGAPKTSDGQIDPCRFRIGSSRLLLQLFQNNITTTDY